MPSVVFDCNFEAETLVAINDLRKVRHDVLVKQISDIGETLDSLVKMGALESSERMSYQKQILDELNHKLDTLKERLTTPETIYSDELEMYLDLLASP